MPKKNRKQATTKNCQMEQNIIRTNIASSLTEKQIWDCPQLLLTHKTFCPEHLLVPQNTPRGSINLRGNGVLPLAERKICDCLKEHPKPKIYNSEHLLLSCVALSDTKIMPIKVKKSSAKNLIPPFNTPIEFASDSDILYQLASSPKYINIIEESPILNKFTPDTMSSGDLRGAQSLSTQTKANRKKSSKANCRSKQHLPSLTQLKQPNKTQTNQPDAAHSAEAIIARKITRKLNFPPHVKVFKNLISLNVDDHPPPCKNKAKKAKKKSGKLTSSSKSSKKP